VAQDDDSDDERRRGERIPINEEFSRDGTTWVSDLSLGGVFVHTSELLPVGSTIELRFTVLVDDPVLIEAVGKVVRHSRKPMGMGVQFAAMRPEMSQQIEEVLARQQPLDSGTPLRLPEPRPHSATRVEQLELEPAGEVALEQAASSHYPHIIDDEPTASFARPVEDAGEEQGSAMTFRPPPIPGKGKGKGKGEVDEDGRTRVYQALEPDAVVGE
jgi:Tfp pilus assembly protein PilZ